MCRVCDSHTHYITISSYRSLVYSTSTVHWHILTLLDVGETTTTEFGSDKFHSVIGKPMGEWLLLSRWTAKINSYIYTVNIMDYFIWHAVSVGISGGCESTYEETKESEADSQTITSLPGAALLDWATGSQLVVSGLQFPNSLPTESESPRCSEFPFLSDCVIYANTEGVQMCATTGLQTFLKDALKEKRKDSTTFQYIQTLCNNAKFAVGEHAKQGEHSW